MKKFFKQGLLAIAASFMFVGAGLTTKQENLEANAASTDLAYLTNVTSSTVDAGSVYIVTFETSSGNSYYLCNPKTNSKRDGFICKSFNAYGFDYLDDGLFTIDSSKYLRINTTDYLNLSIEDENVTVSMERYTSGETLRLFYRSGKWAIANGNNDADCVWFSEDTNQFVAKHLSELDNQFVLKKVNVNTKYSSLIESRLSIGYRAEIDEEGNQTNFDFNTEGDLAGRASMEFALNFDSTDRTILKNRASAQMRYEINCNGKNDVYAIESTAIQDDGLFGVVIENIDHSLYAETFNVSLKIVFCGFTFDISQRSLSVKSLAAIYRDNAASLGLDANTTAMVTALAA